MIKVQLSKHSKLILLILLVLPVWTTAAEDGCMFTFKMHNPHDVRAVYLLDWIDHPYNYPFLASMAAGDLKPGDTREYNAPCGHFVVTWTIKYHSEEHYTVEINEDGGVHYSQPTDKLLELYKASLEDD